MKQETNNSFPECGEFNSFFFSIIFLALSLVMASCGDDDDDDDSEIPQSETIAAELILFEAEVDGVDFHADLSPSASTVQWIRNESVWIQVTSSDGEDLINLQVSGDAVGTYPLSANSPSQGIYTSDGGDGGGQIVDGDILIVSSSESQISGEFDAFSDNLFNPNDTPLKMRGKFEIKPL